MAEGVYSKRPDIMGALRDKGLWFGVAPEPLPAPTGRGKKMPLPYVGSEPGMAVGERPFAPAPVPVSAPAVAAVPAPVAPVAPSAVPPVAEPTPHPMSKWKNEYDYAASLPDKDFKAFVDKHKDNPEFKGIGYIESGKKLQRVISRPEQPGLPPMNPEQLNAVSQMLGVGERMQSDRARNAIERDKLTHAIAETDLKTPANVAKMILQYSPKKRVNKIDPETQMNLGYEDIPDIETGIKMFKAMGVPVSDEVMKQFQAPVKPKMTEVEARAALTAKKITGKAADDYIATYKKSGVVQ